jgi:hypothetical protein
MPFKTIRPTLLSLALLVGFGLPSSASAENCSYEDLQGQFTVSVDCSELQNFSGTSQDMKRLWLFGPLGEVLVMEAPEPYQTVEVSTLLKTLGRHWTSRRSAEVRTIQFGDGEALVTTRRRISTSARTIIFKLNERNVTARLSVVVPRKEADAALDKLEAAFVSGFALKEATP